MIYAVRKPAREMTAMELVELALDLPPAERRGFIAGSAQPTQVRMHALRLLKQASRPDFWPARGESAEPSG